jgi:hypothetical protein
MPQGKNYQTDSVPVTPVGAHGTNASLGAAVTLTPPAGADRLVIQAQAQTVRYTLDGTTPTASVGFQLFAGDTATIQVGAGLTVRIIEETSGAAVGYQWAA